TPMLTQHLLPLVGASLLAACSTAQDEPVQSAADPIAATRPEIESGEFFRRIATFPVFENSDVKNETVAEIISVSADGMTLVYTDSELEAVGFVDISDPAAPAAGGHVPVGGEPTSITVRGELALACVNTSADYVDTAGDLVVIDIAGRAIVRRIALGGQPDSIAVSKDGRYAAVCIENERDESLDGGALPQLPTGWLVVIDLVGLPADWTQRRVELTGLAEVAPSDPEPEFVDINGLNQAVVTLQENNHVVLVDLASGEVTGHFSAGTVDL
ncbi:MAG: alkaline phosphatase, partial [Proteobacteria bacterium]|nr:alkaline phosphatase [Pseudomonadota bacterium]